MPRSKKLPLPPCPLPKAFAHHQADGSVDRNALIGVSMRFRFLRLQCRMTAADIIVAANHLAAHFEELQLTVPPSIQAIRTSRRATP